MSFELFKCVPMDAMISSKQCHHNRTLKENTQRNIWPDARCKTCSGLSGVPVEVEGVTVVSCLKRCKIKGCSKQAQGGKDGMCKAHHTAMKKAELLADEVVFVDVGDGTVAADVVDQAGWVQPVIASNGQCVVSGAELLSSDYVAYLRLLLDEKLEEWSSDLTDAATPRLRAERYINMCNAAEGLGY